ncbi:hypothetical protein TNCV_4415811 [Trichonephila clavipes]|uniref:Uncharacterized protein n=1 Tax=Trichonephila clavipes TaxID=2585209 RepID=A0A8X6VE27_TRICX|nr:hypothetical protein TNCV_4415811 [Trichonephila clavipes]
MYVKSDDAQCPSIDVVWKLREGVLYLRCRPRYLKEIQNDELSPMGSQPEAIFTSTPNPSESIHPALSNAKTSKPRIPSNSLQENYSVRQAPHLMM